MSLLGNIRKVNKAIITDPLCGHNQPIEMRSATETPVIINVNAIVTDHTTMIDPQTGFEVAAHQVHVLVSIDALLEKGYPVYRDDKKPNRPKIKNDIITYYDLAGVKNVVKIKLDKPDTTSNNISCFCVECDDD